MVNATSLWHLNDTSSGLLTEMLTPQHGYKIIKSLYSLISIGTERIVASGQVPENQFVKMKVPYQVGDFGFPVKYGYSMIVEDEDGNKYHVMHPHQDRIQVQPGDLFLIPAHLPAKRAVLISNLETACTGYWDGNPDENEKILIVGYGLIGALLANWIKLKGHKNLTILESNAYRKSLALKSGFSVVEEKLQDFDLLYNTTSNQSGLQYCIDHANMEGRIIEMSWYGNKPTILKLGESFHSKRLSIKSSQVSQIPKTMSTLWDFTSRKKEVLAMLEYDNWDDLLEMEITLQDSVFWFERIRSGPIDPLSIVIKY